MKRVTHHVDKRAYSLQFMAGVERLRCISIVTLNFQMENYGVKDVILVKCSKKSFANNMVNIVYCTHTHTHTQPRLRTRSH